MYQDAKGIFKMQHKRRQKEKEKLIVMAMHGIIIVAIAITAITIKSEANQTKDVTKAIKVSTPEVATSTQISYSEVYETPEVEVQQIEQVQQQMYPEFSYSKDWDAEDSYLLAKIAMAEAEGENIQTKTLVILTVLNRVHSNVFPNTIKEVIFEKNGNTYQFSPIGDGRWDKVKPNEECFEAVQVVMETQYDYSDGALYFETCADENNWHSRNLQFLYQSENMRFYK